MATNYKKGDGYSRVFYRVLYHVKYTEIIILYNFTRDKANVWVVVKVLLIIMLLPLKQDVSLLKLVVMANILRYFNLKEFKRIVLFLVS